MNTAVTVTFRTGRRVTGSYLASGPKRVVLRVGDREKSFRRTEIRSIQPAH